MALRLRSGYSTKAYSLGPDGWFPPESNLATVTAIVQLAGAPGICYMLTAGHAFRDVDVNRGKNIPGNNIIGIAPQGMVRAANQPSVSWGEDRMGFQVPYGTSSGLYHCAGDKIGSLYDAALALLAPGIVNGAGFNQQYAGPAGLLTLIGFDTQWPPRALAPGESYLLGAEQKLEASLLITNRFATDWPSWNNVAAADLDNVMYLVRDQNSSPTTPGMSGKALVRTIPGTQNATIIAMFLGVAKDRNVPGSPVYEIYQHISQAVNNLNISPVLP